MSGFEDLPLQEQQALEERARTYLDPREQNDLLYASITNLLDQLETEDREQETQRVGHLAVDAENTARIITADYFGEPRRGHTPTEFFATLGHVRFKGDERVYVSLMRPSVDSPGKNVERPAVAFKAYAPGRASHYARPYAEIQFDARDWLPQLKQRVHEKPYPNHLISVWQQLTGETLLDEKPE